MNCENTVELFLLYTSRQCTLFRPNFVPNYYAKLCKRASPRCFIQRASHKVSHSKMFVYTPVGSRAKRVPTYNQKSYSKSVVYGFKNSNSNKKCPHKVYIIFCTSAQGEGRPNTLPNTKCVSWGGWRIGGGDLEKGWVNAGLNSDEYLRQRLQYARSTFK